MTKEKTQGFSLGSFTCAVLGVGGLGCNIAVHLAGAGVKELILCDFDRVKKGNLNRQFLYKNGDIGKEKAEAAKERLSEYAPEVKITAVNKKATREYVPECFRECDIIFIATDNKVSREIMSDFCRENSIPLVLGGIDGFYGKAYLYIPRITPCPSCAGMLDGKKAKTNVSTAAGIVGSFEASLGVQYLLTENTSLGGTLTVYDEASFSSLAVKPTKTCKHCKNIFKKEETR